MRWYSHSLLAHGALGGLVLSVRCLVLSRWPGALVSLGVLSCTPDLVPRPGSRERSLCSNFDCAHGVLASLVLSSACCSCGSGTLVCLVLSGPGLLCLVLSCLVLSVPGSLVWLALSCPSCVCVRLVFSVLSHVSARSRCPSCVLVSLTQSCALMILSRLQLWCTFALARLRCSRAARLRCCAHGGALLRLRAAGAALSCARALTVLSCTGLALRGTLLFLVHGRGALAFLAPYLSFVCLLVSGALVRAHSNLLLRPARSRYFPLR